jgi:hypothetical protein
MALFALFTLLLAGAGALLLAKVFFNLMPNTRRLKADLQKMKDDMNKWTVELVPLTDEELELVSFNQDKQVVRKGITKTARGIYTSIYHEPILAYSYKEYAGSGRTGLLYVRTARHEFVYTLTKKGVSIAIDNKEVGVLQTDGILYGAKSRRMIARINREAEEFLPIIVNDKEIASVAKYDPKEDAKMGKRAFEFIREDLEGPEKEVFLALGVLEVIEQTLG